MNSTVSTQRYFIIGIVNPQGQKRFRILNTETFEFEPRTYAYHPARECAALNDPNIITVEAIEITSTEREL